VNAIKTEGNTTISPVFGYKASGGGYTTSVPAVLAAEYRQNANGSLVISNGQWVQVNEGELGGRVLKIEEIMTASDPTSSSYNAAIAGAVNNQIANASYGTSSFASLISYGPEAALNFTVDAVAANRIEQLRSKFSNPLSLITSDIASTVSSWKNLDKVNQVVGKQLADRRESISGINLDEEAANLVKFQQMYGAASKVMQTANQMFNMLLNMLST
jgi:flagellar hook-associated protein FlgK